MHPCQRGAESLGLPGSLLTNLHSQSGCAVRASPVTPVGLLRVLPLQAVAVQGAGQRERRQEVAACSLAEQLGTKATKGVAHCLLRIRPTSDLRAVYFCHRSKLRKIFSGTSCQCKVDSEPHRLRSNFLSWPCLDQTQHSTLEQTCITSFSKCRLTLFPYCQLLLVNLPGQTSVVQTPQF